MKEGLEWAETGGGEKRIFQVSDDWGSGEESWRGEEGWGMAFRKLIQGGA